MKAFLSSNEHGIQLGEQNIEAVLPDFFLSPLPCSLSAAKWKHMEVTSTIVN